METQIYQEREDGFLWVIGESSVRAHKPDRISSELFRTRTLSILYARIYPGLVKILSGFPSRRAMRPRKGRQPVRCARDWNGESSKNKMQEVSDSSKNLDGFYGKKRWTGILS